MLNVLASDLSILGLVLVSLSLSRPERSYARPIPDIIL